MPQEKICGSTLDIAELVVDYTKPINDRIDIKHVPTKDLVNTLTTAYGDWIGFLFKYLGIATGVLWIASIFLGTFFRVDLPFDLQQFTIKYILSVLLVLPAFISLLHLNKKFDDKWKKVFAIRTGDKPKNKATFSNFKSKEFILYDISNIVINWDPSGDVNKQLTKVWIRKDPYSSLYENQATTKGLLWVSEGAPSPIWSAHFFFKKIPKDGELYVEWI